MSRTLLGIATALALGVSAWAWWTDANQVIGVAARVAAILGAMWIAYPAFEKVNARSLLLGGLALLILLFRPRAALVVLPVLALTLGRPHSRN